VPGDLARAKFGSPNSCSITSALASRHTLWGKSSGHSLRSRGRNDPVVPLPLGDRDWDSSMRMLPNGHHVD
jgi:hypothetical protein